MHPQRLDDDEPDPTLRPFSMIGDMAGRRKLLREIGGVRRNEDAVAEGHSTMLNGVKTRG